MITEFLRSDGRKGIRNTLVVAYLVECAHHVAREITLPFRDRDVHLIGFPGCFPNEYAQRMMEALCTHPNVGGALLISLGCESFNKYQLADVIRASGRPVETLVIQGSGGTRKTVEAGQAFVSDTLPALEAAERVPMEIGELVIGTVCGGSDGTSGITGNPAAGLAFDRHGRRLGQGRGYYDRALAAARSRGDVLAVGFGLDQQEVEAVPTDVHDQPLDGLLVPGRGFRRIRR